jgi:hypothetical protein
MSRAYLAHLSIAAYAFFAMFYLLSRWHPRPGLRWARARGAWHVARFVRWPLLVIASLLLLLSVI